MSKKSPWNAGVLILALSLTGWAQTPPSEQDQEKMMEAFMKMSALNENHERLKDFAGDWTVSTKAWMHPGAEPEISENTASSKLILGGRFLKTTFKGAMFGRPFEGWQIVGYDNLKKKYVTFWIDNSSTAFFLLEGRPDESGKTIIDEGDWADPVTGGTIKVRTVTTIVSADEFVYEMHMLGPGDQSFKSLENRCRRIKSPQE